MVTTRGTKGREEGKERERGKRRKRKEEEEKEMERKIVCLCLCIYISMCVCVCSCLCVCVYERERDREHAIAHTYLKSMKQLTQLYFRIPYFGLSFITTKYLQFPSNKIILGQFLLLSLTVTNFKISFIHLHIQYFVLWLSFVL